MPPGLDPHIILVSQGHLAKVVEARLFSCKVGRVRSSKSRYWPEGGLPSTGLQFCLTSKMPFLPPH